MHCARIPQPLTPHTTRPGERGRLQLGAWQRDRKTRDCRKPVSVGFASRCCRMCCRYPSLAFTIAFYCFMWLSFREFPPLTDHHHPAIPPACLPLQGAKCTRCAVPYIIACFVLSALKSFTINMKEEQSNFVAKKRKDRQLNGSEPRRKSGANIMPQIIFISCMRLSALS